MNITQLKKQLSENIIESIYFFYGAENYLKDLYAKRIKDFLFADTSLQHFNFMQISREKSLSLAALSEFCDGVPFMSEKKLLIIKNCEVLKSAATRDFLSDLVSNMPDHLVIIIVDDEIDKRSKLYKSIEKSGAIVEFSHQQHADLKAWANRLLLSFEKKATASDISYLIDSVGSDMYALASEIDKLCAFAGDREIITKAIIDSVVTKSVENRIFELADSMLSCDSEKTYNIINELNAKKEQPVRVFSLISKHMSDLYKVKTCSLAGMQSSAIASVSKIAPFVVSKYMRQVGKIDVKVLSKIIKLCANVDVKLKSSTVDSWVLIESFSANVLSVTIR